MSHQYQLNWTDPQLKPQSLTVIPETKNTSTSIALFGHHYADFGSALNKNLMSLLENFASRGIEPTNPTIGQLWYDATVGALKICTTISNIGIASWKLVDFINGPSAPTQPACSCQSSTISASSTSKTRNATCSTTSVILS
jgi:hypothetical protein